VLVIENHIGAVVPFTGSAVASKVMVLPEALAGIDIIAAPEGPILTERQELVVVQSVEAALRLV
jgi:hypothetical protein